MGQVKKPKQHHIRLWPENVVALEAIRKGPEKRSSLAKLANGLLYTYLYCGKKK